MLTPSLPALLTFVLLVLLVSLAWIAAMSRLSRRLGVLGAVVLAVWLAFTATLAHRGLLHAMGAFPPPAMRLVLSGVLAVMGIGLSPLGKRLANETPLAWLVGFQAFRLPLEIVLWQLHQDGALPVQMTYAGQNFDVLSGVFALVLAIAIARGRVARGWLWAWNLVSLGLLINIVQISIRSMPGPMRTFQNEPANTLIFGVPWIWLPTILVLSALAGHVLVARRLLTDRQSHAG